LFIHVKCKALCRPAHTVEGVVLRDHSAPAVCTDRSSQAFAS
jgi:hypothetical protein